MTDYSRKVHLRDPRWNRPVCNVPGPVVTDEQDEVTCQTCLALMRRRRTLKLTKEA